MTRVEILKHRNGRTSVRTHYNDIGQIHRNNGPAEYHYDIDGVLVKLVYYKHGRIHNDNAPARIIYDPSTSTIITEQWFKNGKPHKIDGPARTDYFKGKVLRQYWFWDGKELTYDMFSWFLDNKINNKPTIEDKMAIKLTWGEYG